MNIIVASDASSDATTINWCGTAARIACSCYASKGGKEARRAVRTLLRRSRTEKLWFSLMLQRGSMRMRCAHWCDGFSRPMSAALLGD